jgi:hypothetical protein
MLMQGSAEIGGVGAMTPVAQFEVGVAWSQGR